MENELDVQNITLDDFRTWDEVHAPNSNWVALMREASEDEWNAATKRLDEVLVRQFLEETIPPKDRFADLKTLQTSEKSQMPVEFQGRILSAMRKQYFRRWAPDESGLYGDRDVYGWAFFGPAGWSKSTLCTAWFAEYVRQNVIDVDRLRNDRRLARIMEFPKGRVPQSFWRMNALNLIDENLAWQHRDFADKDAKQPRVSSNWIEQLESLGFRPCLYLEEVDKVRTDKAKLDILFDTINALYNYRGVLLLNSNLTKQEFASQFGPEFARRISEMCNVVDCFALEIKLAKEAK